MNNQNLRRGKMYPGSKSKIPYVNYWYNFKLETTPEHFRNTYQRKLSVRPYSMQNRMPVLRSIRWRKKVVKKRTK